MFGIRSVPIFTRCMSITTRPFYLPKPSFALANLETTNMLSKISMVPGNLLIRNLLEMLEKQCEEPQSQIDKNVKTISMIGQGTLRMSHIRVCLGI